MNTKSVIVLKYYGIRKKHSTTLFETRTDVALLAAISVLSRVLCAQTQLLFASGFYAVTFGTIASKTLI